MSVLLNFSTNIQPEDITLSGCFAEERRKCIVECEVVWKSGASESCNTRGQAMGQRFLYGHCTNVFKMYFSRTVHTH